MSKTFNLRKNCCKEGKSNLSINKIKRPESTKRSDKKLNNKGNCRNQ